MTKESFFSRTINRSFYYGLSTILGRIVGFLMLPIYTNYLTPKDYGVAGFLVLYVSLVQTVLGGNLEHAVTKFHYDKKITASLGQICTSSAFVTLVFCIVPVTVGVLYADRISELLFSTAEYGLVVLISSFNILLASLEIYGLQYVKIIDKPKLYLALNVLKLMLQLVINVVLVVYYEIGIVGIIASSAISSAVLAIITFVILFYSEPVKNILFSLIKPLLKFSAPLWVSGLLGLYSGSSHQVFIKFYSGLDSLGLYNLGATFGALVGALFLAPFFSFWQVERFRVYEKENAIELFKKTFYVISSVALLLGFIIGIISGPVIQIMADGSFHDAYKVVMPLAISSVIMPLCWYLNFSFLVKDRSKELAKNSLIYAFLITIIYSSIIPRWGYEGAAYGVMLASMCNLHFIHYRAKKFYDIGVSIFKVDLGVGLALLSYFLFVYSNPWIEYPYGSLSYYAALIILIVGLSILTIRGLFPRQYKSIFMEASRLLKSLRGKVS